MESKRGVFTNPTELSIIQKLLESIAEETGVILRRTAYSPNIKERMDFSTAIFDSKARLVAQAEHIPVHLASMPLSVQEAMKEYGSDLSEGDIVVLNDPWHGGTHLPDVTLITPVIIAEVAEFYVANRAHHADIGGFAPGSMPGESFEIFQEGLIIPPILLYRNWKESKDVMNLLMANVRTPEERRGDLRAQYAALRFGVSRMESLAGQIGLQKLKRAVIELAGISKRAMQKQLRLYPEGCYNFRDFMDPLDAEGNLIPISCQVTLHDGQARVAFEGTSEEVRANINAPFAVTLSATYYVFRCLVHIANIATNFGCYEPIEVVKPPLGSLLNPEKPAAVSSGNVETSQRIVDCLLGALAQAVNWIPAASQGTMNNLTIGGYDTRSKTKQAFTYYETIAGGMGARSTKDGFTCHTHMTNTANTPIEVLEITYPLRIRAYSLADSTGGNGKHRGGFGLRREILLLEDCVVSIQSSRRMTAPWGLHGGEAGISGKNWIETPTGDIVKLTSRVTAYRKAGDIICIQSPGGGGRGVP
ncbi:MAG: hydantoinase B/oxoprolinase family protein [Candidatus Heimdallarchaeota archaeon]